MVKQRYELLDTLRGFSLVNMIFYHFIWDLIYIFPLSTMSGQIYFTSGSNLSVHHLSSSPVFAGR